ncbi:hypothetical protein ACFYP6_32415 [Streptomyces goshikiensis]|uniref:hypothetical protein n=1 Tax=Streptomyces goshikiensis TaxID=1942 RepID=UPI00368EBFA3
MRSPHTRGLSTSPCRRVTSRPHRLTAGNVLNADLDSVLSSPRWAEASASIPRRTDPTACHPDCQPSNSDSCDPGKNDPCDPMGYAPTTLGAPAAAVPVLL